MKITRQQLRRIIKEATEPMTPDYVKKQMSGKGVRTGAMFMDTALDAVAAGDLRAAASAVMDGLWIDDPPMGADVELEDLLSTVQTEDDLAAVAADWGTKHFRSR